MIEGALILLAGIIVGRLLPRRDRQPRRPAFECDCKHSLSMHDPQTGRCQEKIRVYFRIDPKDDPIVGTMQYGKTMPDLCGCQQYVGPERPEVIVEQWQPPRLRR